MRIATNKKREEQLKAINKDLRKRIRKALKHIEKNEWVLTEMGFDVKKHKAILLGVGKE